MLRIVSVPVDGAALRDFIRTRRRKLGITQAELAEHIGRSTRWLQRVEDGTDGPEPGLDSVLLLLTVLDTQLRIDIEVEDGT